MSEFDIENAKILRKALDVECGIRFIDDTAPITNIESDGVEYVGTVGDELYDENLTYALTTSLSVINPVSDLDYCYWEDEGGFRLEDVHLVGKNHIASSEGKYGYRCKLISDEYLEQHDYATVGCLRVSSSAELSVLTVHTYQGEGYFTVYDGESDFVNYPMGGTTIIYAGNQTDVLITIVSKPSDKAHQQRVIIDSIISGVNFDFNNDDLISCVLDLRSDLSLDAPTWQVSGIEINAYYPYDINNVIANLSEEAQIYYRAGYADSQTFSRDRWFRVSEKITQQSNVITIKGEDVSSRLDYDTLIPTIQHNKAGLSKKALYEDMENNISRVIGIFPEDIEPAPTGSDTGTDIYRVNKSCTIREWLADVMNLSHDDDFYPRFVDAGYPTLKWSKPTPQWDIYEEDVANLVIDAERKINKITTDDEYALLTGLTNEGNATIETFETVKDTNYEFSDGGYYFNWSVTNGTPNLAPTKNNAETFTFKATSGTESSPGQSVLTANRMAISNTTPGGGKTITPSSYAEPNRAGITITKTPLIYGSYSYYDGSVYYGLYPNYRQLFHRSNVTGSFTFRGDVRMQPRDVFNFHRMDGTTEVCTIENIKLMHENGGLTSEITYRKGIV